LYEHDARPDGQLELTLLRGVGHMFVDFNTYAPLDAVEEGQCLGPQRLDYALLPHGGELPVERLAEAAAAFNAPLRVVQADHHSGELPPRHSFLELEPPALQLAAVKRAEDRASVIVRCYNTTGAAVQGRLRVARAWRAAYRITLDEQRTAQGTLAGGALELEVAPWQIVTIELEEEGGSCFVAEPSKGEMLRDRSVRLLVLTIALVFVRPFITDLLAPAPLIRWA
jgi:alpha-mannosidase